MTRHFRLNPPMKDKYYAHSREGKSIEEWHRLEDHLKAVAEVARRFAGDFNAGDWSYWQSYHAVKKTQQ